MLTFLKNLFKRKVQDGRPAGYGTDSEYCAEVVLVTKVEPHPNADRLDLVQFSMATGPCSYQVVSGKGGFQVGDKAAYFSVDCIVPLSRPEFGFLGQRLDGVGKSHYRLRAARLRGVFSQGLLTPINQAYPVGKFIGEEFGVVYHQPPAADEGPTKPTARPKKQPMPVYTVDSLKKLPNLFAPDEPVTITEKIHGTNFRFGWVPRRVLGINFGYKFVVGSHRVIKAGQGKDWYGSDVWTQAAMRMGLKEKAARAKGSIFFGELYGYTYDGKAIQDLTYGRKPEDGPGLAIFDIKTPNGFMTFPERNEECVRLELPQVPLVASDFYFDMTEAGPSYMAEGKSTLDKTQLREGIVVESDKPPRRKAKYVSQAYLTRKDA